MSSSPEDDVEFSATGPLFHGIPPSENKPYKLALGVGSVKAAVWAGESRDLPGAAVRSGSFIFRVAFGRAVSCGGRVFIFACFGPMMRWPAVADCWIRHRHGAHSDLGALVNAYGTGLWGESDLCLQVPNHERPIELCRDICRLVS